jgi:hypothetical protein
MNGFEGSLRDTCTETFNDMLGEFSRKLIGAFPNHATEFKRMYGRVLIAISLDKRMAIDAFSDALDDEILALVSARDDMFFSSGRAEGITLFNGIDMKECWAGTNQGVRNSVWEYINLLVAITERHRSIDGLLNTYPEVLESAELKEMVGTLEVTARELQATVALAGRELTLAEITETLAMKMGLNASQLEDLKQKQVEMECMMRGVKRKSS